MNHTSIKKPGTTQWEGKIAHLICRLLKLEVTKPWSIIIMRGQFNSNLADYMTVLRLLTVVVRAYERHWKTDGVMAIRFMLLIYLNSIMSLFMTISVTIVN